MKYHIATIIITLVLSNLNAQNLDLKFESKEDLNQDNTLEEVKLEVVDGCGYRLKIDDKEITGQLGGNIEGYLLVDINKWDSYKEIAVYTPGPSSDDEFAIYWYNGNEIMHMATLEKWPTFNGNGIVYVDGWMGFWAPREKYVLDNATRKLQLVDQYAYHVGIKVKVNTGFKIYLEKELKNEVALLSDNSTVEIVLCDMKDLEYAEYKYLIKSSSKLLGWTDFKTLNTCAELHMAD